MHVLIADDNHAFTDVVSSLVADVNGITLITVAHEGRAALRAANELDLDAAIVDLAMPLVSGVQVVKRLRERNPYAVVIILTATDDPEAKRKALENGADAILSKSDYIEQLTEHLAVAEGRQSWPKAQVHKL